MMVGLDCTVLWSEHLGLHTVAPWISFSGVTKQKFGTHSISVNMCVKSVHFCVEMCSILISDITVKNVLQKWVNTLKSCTAFSYLYRCYGHSVVYFVM